MVQTIIATKLATQILLGNTEKYVFFKNPVPISQIILGNDCLNRDLEGLRVLKGIVTFPSKFFLNYGSEIFISVNLHILYSY